MSDRLDLTISGIDVTIDAGAVQVTGDEPLTILSSAVVGGGLCSARHVVRTRTCVPMRRGAA